MATAAAALQFLTTPDSKGETPLKIIIRGTVLIFGVILVILGLGGVIFVIAHTGYHPFKSDTSDIKLVYKILFWVGFGMLLLGILLFIIGLFVIR